MFSRNLFIIFIFLIIGGIISPVFSLLAALPADDPCVLYCANKYDADKNPNGVHPPVGRSCLCSRDNPKCPASDPNCKHHEEGIIDRATNWIFYFGLILAPLFVLIGAFMFFTSGGESKRTTDAKKVIIWSVVGLAVALCTKLIYHLIRFLIGQ